MNNSVISPEIYTFFGAIIGVIVGSFLTYLFALLIENRREEREKKKEIEFKKRIVSLVSQELKAYSAYLEKQLVIYKNAPSNEKKSYSIAFLTEFNTLSRHYINMNPELKAKVFDIDTSRTLEKVYQFMQLLTAKIAELSQQAQPTKFEFEIESLKHDIALGLNLYRI